jgi:hypothetical protein
MSARDELWSNDASRDHDSFVCILISTGLAVSVEEDELRRASPYILARAAVCQYHPSTDAMVGAPTAHEYK